MTLPSSPRPTTGDAPSAAPFEPASATIAVVTFNRSALLTRLQGERAGLDEAAQRMSWASPLRRVQMDRQALDRLVDRRERAAQQALSLRRVHVQGLEKPCLTSFFVHFFFLNCCMCSCHSGHRHTEW